MFPTPPAWKKMLKFILFLGLVFVVGGIAGVVFEHYFIPRFASQGMFNRFAWLKQATENVTVINKTEQVVIREDDSIASIVSQPATAVVNIITPATATEKMSQETGVLITNDGLIVTYATDGVAHARRAVRVLLFDGTNHPARYVGMDTLTNLLYYRIDGVNTPSIALANSDDTRVGKKLIAISNAAVEYQNRLAMGTLGNINRTFNLAGKTVASSEKWEGVFEMDVPQGEDFVGGPAIGYSGELVGLVGKVTIDNTDRFFLIPANAVRASLELAINDRLTDRPTLGAYYLSLTKAYALGNTLSRDRGALIYSPSGKTALSLIAGSPAEKAGLRYGDIVIAVNGQEINLDWPLSVALGKLTRGGSADFLILRDGIEQTLKIAL